MLEELRSHFYTSPSRLMENIRNFLYFVLLNKIKFNHSIFIAQFKNCTNDGFHAYGHSLPVNDRITFWNE